MRILIVLFVLFILSSCSSPSNAKPSVSVSDSPENLLKQVEKRMQDVKSLKMTYLVDRLNGPDQQMIMIQNYKRKEFSILGYSGNKNSSLVTLQNNTAKIYNGNKLQSEIQFSDLKNSNPDLATMYEQNQFSIDSFINLKEASQLKVGRTSDSIAITGQLPSVTLTSSSLFGGMNTTSSSVSFQLFISKETGYLSEIRMQVLNQHNSDIKQTKLYLYFSDYNDDIPISSVDDVQNQDEGFALAINIPDVYIQYGEGSDKPNTLQDNGKQIDVSTTKDGSRKVIVKGKHLDYTLVLGNTMPSHSVGIDLLPKGDSLTVSDISIYLSKDNDFEENELAASKSDYGDFFHPGMFGFGVNPSVRGQNEIISSFPTTLDRFYCKVVYKLTISRANGQIDSIDEDDVFELKKEYFD